MCLFLTGGWVEHVLQKRDRIIASGRKQETLYLKRSHTFSIDSLRLWRKLMPWIPRIAMSYEQTQYPKG